MVTMPSPSLSRGPGFAVVAAGIALSFALGAAAFVSVVVAAPATAHTALLKITPYDGAQLSAAPTKVVLEFNEPVSRSFATVVVSTVAGVAVTRGKPTVLGAKVTQLLSPDLASGRYRVAYRLVSADGHPVSGESKFTLTLPPAASPATPAGVRSTSARASASASVSAPGGATTPSVPAAAPPAKKSQPLQSGWLSPLLVPIAGAVGLLAIGGGVLRWDRRRR